MRRDLNTCSSQSAIRHGVRARVLFRRSTTAEATAAAHLDTLTLSTGTLFFSYYSGGYCAREWEEKKHRADPAIIVQRSGGSSSIPAAAVSAKAEAAEEDAKSTTDYLRIQQ